MKKSKILMPILGTVGTVAAVAPMVCLVSCSTIEVDFGSNNSITDRKSKKDSDGNWVLRGQMGTAFSSINHANSYVQVNDNEATKKSFGSIGSPSITVLLDANKYVSITILASCLKNFSSNIKSIQVYVYCD